MPSATKNKGEKCFSCFIIFEQHTLPWKIPSVSRGRILSPPLARWMWIRNWWVRSNLDVQMTSSGWRRPTKWHSIEFQCVFLRLPVSRTPSSEDRPHPERIISWGDWTGNFADGGPTHPTIHRCLKEAVSSLGERFVILPVQILPTWAFIWRSRRGEWIWTQGPISRRPEDVGICGEDGWGGFFLIDFEERDRRESVVSSHLFHVEGSWCQGGQTSKNMASFTPETQSVSLLLVLPFIKSVFASERLTIVVPKAFGF